MKILISIEWLPMPDTIAQVFRIKTNKLENTMICESAYTDSRSVYKVSQYPL